MNIQKLNPTVFFKRTHTATFIVLFALLPIIYVPQVFETASLPRHILITSVACFLLLLYSIQFLFKNITLTLSYLHLSFLFFLCWALISILWSADIKNSFIELTQLSVYFIIAFFSSQLKNKEIKNIFLAIFIGASIAAVIGILQAFKFNPFEFKMSTALASTFNNKNHASVFFDLVIPLALISMLTTKSYAKYIASITYTLAITFILIAKTKGSLLGFLIFTIFFLILIYKNKSIQSQLLNKKNIFRYLFLSFIFPLFVYILTTIYFISSDTPQQWNAGLTQNSTSIRLAWYKNAYSMLKDNLLLGVGYGAFRKGFAPYASNPNIVKSLTEDQAVAQLHNDPYQNFLELGFIGGISIIVIFSYIIFRASYLLSVKEIKNKGSPNFLLLGSFLALISSITHSFVDFPMQLPSSAVLFWFLTGLMIRFIPNVTFKLKFNNNLNRIIMSISVFFLATVLTIHSYDLYSRYFYASKLTYNASVSIQKNKNCSQAIKEIDQAINLYFEDAFIRQRYVQLHTACNLNAQSKLTAMNRVLSYDTTNARAHLTRASIFLAKRNLKRAAVDFEYVIYMFPHRPAAYLGLGDIATLKKEYKKARKYYEKVKSLDMNNKKASFMLKQFDLNGV